MTNLLFKRFLFSWFVVHALISSLLSVLVFFSVFVAWPLKKFLPKATVLVNNQKCRIGIFSRPNAINLVSFKWAVGIIPRLTIGDLYLIDSQDLYLGFLRQTGFVPKIRNKSRLYICQMRFVSNCPN